MTETNNVMKKGGTTGYHLKLIALITMFIDHIGAVVVWRVLVASYQVRFLTNGCIVVGAYLAQDTVGDNLLVWVASNQELVYTIYEYIRLIGRMAFPIYCFLLVEGFLHTRSVKNYALRLLAFAFVSEIPFDLALTGNWWSIEYSNVFFTLFLGLVLIWGVSYVEKFFEFWEEKNWDPFLGKMLTLIIGGVFAASLGLFAEMVLCTDYGMAGVFAILIIYLFRKSKELGFALSVLLLSILSSDTEIIALLMLWPLMKYDGTRGKKTKYFFYAFYPAHLLVLAFICMGIGV